MAARPAAPAKPAPVAWPRPVALAVLAAWASLLVLAPPAHNAFWGVNGLRSVSPGAALLVVLAAFGAAALAWRPPRHGALVPALALALATLLALPLREAAHHLGDTATRQGAAMNHHLGTYAQSLREWSHQLHAQPLDVAISLLLASELTTLTGSTERAFAIVSWPLALAAFACAWRLARRLDGGRGAAPGLWLALIAWGGLQAFAGYAESAGLVIVAVLAWWAAMFAPLARGRDAAWLVGAWMFAALSHRTALLLFAPMLLRVLGAPLAGDTARVRWLALAGTLAVAAAGAVLAFASGGGQLGTDVRDLLRPLDPAVFESLPSDLVNLLLLVAPLALAAALLAGGEAWRAFVRDPRAAWLGLTAVLALPLAFPLPVASNGLGVHRDWDLSVLPGATLTVAGAVLLSHASAARLRGALVAALPVLVAGSLGWVAVHADASASLRRVEALARHAPRLAPVQRSAVLLFAGNRAMDRGQPRRAAGLLQTSWELVPSPGRGTHATLAWLVAGETDSARAMVARLRARGGLDARSRATLDTLERQIEVVEHLPRR